jgi:phosphomannomutase
MKKVFIFDLDGTLAESKAAVDGEMGALLADLLATEKVAVISGGDWPQFERQLLSRLPRDQRLRNLSLLPTRGTKFYQYTGEWKKILSEDLTSDEKEKIIRSLKQALANAGSIAEQVWGEIIEDRGSQITLSALGQLAPIDAKRSWDPEFAKRRKIKALLDELIPEFCVRMGGTTSIDVTALGVDKAYGICKLRDILGIGIQEMMFVGDALFPAGGDYPAREAGVLSIRVKNPEESKRIIQTILVCQGGVQPHILRRQERGEDVHDRAPEYAGVGQPTEGGLRD